MEKNPSMKKSTAFAVATQQSHATGHTPAGYGTAEGRRKAKKKYPHAEQYAQTADPGSKSKSSSIDLALLMGFSDELTKIAGLPKPKKLEYSQPKEPPVEKPRQVPEPLPPPIATAAV